MISVDEANQFILSATKEFNSEKVPLLQSLHRTLAAPVTADRDMPSYHRVMMDGIAIDGLFWSEGQRQFAIKKMAAAGAPMQTLTNRKHCIEVTTGAVLPLNTNVVIPYEQLRIQNNIADVKTENIALFQHIHRQATDAAKGDVLLHKNCRITPAHISVMATVGLCEVPVYRVPSVAVCSTGDELVDVAQTPLPHQVRQSNVYFMAADLAKENISVSLYHLPDEEDKMKAQLETILQQHDVVLLSGAVSKGRKDYLPQTLAGLGMQTLFHGVAQRPGKPFLFGQLMGKPVFAFPGNPVSTFVCYHLYFKKWLSECLQQSNKKIMAKLSADVANSSSLTLHVMVKLSYEEGSCFAQPIGLSSSGDIPAVISADGIISLPPHKKTAHEGEVYEVMLCG